MKTDFISKLLIKKYQKKLVLHSFYARGSGKSYYTYYLSLCLFFLDRPFGFINFKRKAHKALSLPF